MMKQSKIYMRPWLEIHHRTKKTDTDEWYMGLANELLPLVMTFPLYEGNPDVAEDQRRLALTCALYLEDCVADAGNWREFIHWHKRSYGRYLPFYSLTEDYLPDEINREDIAFLLWTLSSKSSDSCPFTSNCLSLISTVRKPTLQLVASITSPFGRFKLTTRV